MRKRQGSAELGGNPWLAMGGICTRAGAPDAKFPRKKTIEGARRMASGSIKMTPTFPCSICGFAGATLGAKKQQVAADHASRSPLHWYACLG